MEDMIAKIIAMDQKARAVTEQVQQDKLNSQQEIQHLKEKIRTDYLNRARNRIEANRTTEQMRADRSLKKIKENQDHIAKQLDMIYQENHKIWVNKIVKHVIEE